MCELKVKTALLAVLMTAISLASAQESLSDPIILTTGSKILRPGYDFSFSVSSRELKQSVTANFTLSGYAENGSYVEMVLKNQELSKFSFKTFKFKTSDLSPGSYSLIIDCYDKVGKKSYRDYQSLIYRTKKFSAFVYTDKGMYKGGDTVKFSIFSIDSETKPYNPKSGVVSIYDSAELKVKTFANVTFVKGKYKGELVLSETPAKGLWKLKFVAEGEVSDKVFEVKDYVLPTYSIKIELPEIVSIFDKTFQVKLIAAYTFGESVEGEAVVLFWKNEWQYVYNPNQWWGSYEMKRVDLFAKTVTIDSAAETFDVDLANDLKVYYQEDINVDVKFTESSTRKVVETSAILNVVYSPYEIIVTGSDTLVKDQPYNLTVSVRRKGTGTPAPVGTSVSVNFYSYSPCYYDVSYYWHCSNVYHYGYPTGYTDASGSVSFQFDPKNDEILSISVYSLSEYASKQATRTRSSGIDAFVLTKNPQIGSPVNISVTSTTYNFTKCFCHMISKGVLVFSRELPFNNKNVILTFTPTFANAPKTEIIFFNTDPNGNVISKQITLDLSKKLPNYVDLELSKSTVKPGQNVTMKVSTKKFSTVSIFGLDTASKLLRSGNDFSKSDVITDLMQDYNPPNYNWYYYSEDVKNFERIDIFAVKRRIVYPLPLTTTKKTTTKITTTQKLTTTAREESQEESTQMMGSEAPSPESPSWFPSAGPSFEGPQEQPSEPSFEGPSGPSVEEPSSPQEGPQPPSQPGSGSGAPIPPPTTRRNFVEVIDIVDTEVTKGKKLGKNVFDPINAEATVFVPVPESITTYDFSAVSMNECYGLGMSEKVTSLKIFQDFFILLTLPHHCKRTEVVYIDIGVFSYLDRNQSVTISVTRNDKEFTVLKPEFDGWTNATNSYWQNFESISGKPKNLRIVVRANMLGSIKIRIDAIGNVASDSLEKPLKVIPEGVPKSITQSVLIMKNNLTSTYSSSLSCVLPPTAVNDTTSSIASVVGDLLGPMIKGLENLVQMSYGCGEQNLLNFVPSIAALRYLESTGQLTDALKGRGISYAEDSYQRQLNYRHYDGSFSAFGNSDPKGSLWLTAFTVDAFEMASKYISIDSNVLVQAYNYFVTRQNSDGSFREGGVVYHRDMQGGSSNGVPLTAFVSIVLSRNLERFPQFKPALDKALDYIATNVDTSRTYDLCICALALQLGNHAGFEILYNEMISKAIETADLLSWGKSDPEPDPLPWWYYYQQRSNDIEMVAYALQVLSTRDFLKAIKAAKYLASKKNAFGGFGSTQDTVQALLSLSNFGTKLVATTTTINLSLKPNIGNVINAQINKDNRLTVQEFTLDPLARQLNISSGVNSTGNAIVALTCNFYEVSDELAPRFTIRTNLIRPCRNLLQLQVCISYIPKFEDVESNMALMKMTLPSGYVYDEGSKLPAIIRLLEKTDGGTTLNAYFDKFTASETCFVIQAVQQCRVEELKISTIEVTDYYSTEKKSQILYNIPEKLPECKDLPPEEKSTTFPPSQTWSDPSWDLPSPSPEEEPSPEEPSPEEPSPEGPSLEGPSTEAPS